MLPSEIDDRFNLGRFVEAQKDAYTNALAELARGRKTSHWIWFIFPQISGLGWSSISAQYAIQSLDEAVAYLAHPILGPRLQECVRQACAHTDLSAEQIFGTTDALKFRSCLTLFALADSSPSVYADALDQFFQGERDPLTLDRLEEQISEF